MSDAAARLRFKLGVARKAFRETELGRPQGLGVRSYSQEGEDRILFSRFATRPAGFYVDVGAHHPWHYSNTRLFYELGWRGINIDANPSLMSAFTDDRRRDINVCVGVGATSGEATFYVFDEPLVSTFDAQIARERDEAWPVQIVRKEVVEIRSLASILDEHLPRGQEITFLSVDVEGRDLDVLQSNDWARHRPEVVLAESLALSSLEAVTSDSVYQFLTSEGYSLVAKTMNTLIFEDTGGRRQSSEI